MVQILKIPSFCIITFNENSIKLVSIKGWFYHKIETLDRGMNNLKQILVSNNVIQYFWKSDEYIERNSMAKSVLVEGMNFYMRIVLTWIKEHNDGITSCILSTPTSKNHLFIDQFVEHYTTEIWGYIIPSSVNHQLDHYERNRQENELDVLTYLNFSESKELV
jgi:hypothetical protein